MQTTSHLGRKYLGFASGLLAGLAFITGTPAKAIAPIGDNSELFITGTATGSYNDNIFLSHTNAADDFIFDLVPGLSYEFGKTNSETTGQVAVSEDFQEFAKKTRLDNQLFNAVAWTKYEDANSSFNFDASYHELDNAERTIQNLSYLVDRDVAHVDGLGELQITDKSSIGGGIVFDDTNYKTNGFTDWRYWQIPVNYYWKLEPKLDVSVGYQYQDNTVGVNAYDSTENYFNVGARGEFTPDLTGKFTVGYLNQIFDEPGKKTVGGLGAASAFTYTVDPKTNLTFGVNDNFGYAATGGDFRDVGVYLGASAAVSDQLSFNGQLGYDWYSYVTTTQRDNFYTLRLGASYTVSTHISLTASYLFATDESNQAAYTFHNNLLTVGATFRY